MKIKVAVIAFLMFSISAFPIKLIASPAVNGGYEKIGTSEYLELYYSYENHTIMLYDKRSNFVWNSAVSDKQYNMENVNAYTKAVIQSLFSFSYNDFQNEAKESVSRGNPISQKPDIKEKFIKNGISINYDFKDINISFSVEIWVDGDSMNARVPMDGVKETGRYGLINIELLPFFGAADTDEDGYMFYPDGSGALMNFKEKPGINSKSYSWYIYGTDNVDLENYKALERADREQAMLPVFGMKKGDNGFLAIIDEGASDTAVNLCPSGYIVNLNRIYAEFTYRRSFPDPRTEVKDSSRVEKEPVRSDHAVKYIFLNGDKANYSGMANTYRNYLIENKGINKVIREGEKIPLGLDLFMGIKEKGLLFDKYIPMTTFSQAQEILKSFSGSGIDKMQVNLKGWTKNGYGLFDVHFPPNRSLGGSEGLKKLSEYAQKQNIQLCLQDNFVDIYKRGNSFSQRYDIVYQIYHTLVTDSMQERFLSNPIMAFARLKNNYLPEMIKNKVNGLAFDKLGSLLYYDYNTRYPVMRKATADYWCKMLEESKKRLGFVSAQGGNSYILPYANRLYDIPVKDSDYFITDEPVPFYQMVVHGLIPYSSDPANLFYDFPSQKLKWVEYGCMPYFELTYKESGLLRYTDYNKLFTSCYLDWNKAASDIYMEFNVRLVDIWSQCIVEHKKLKDDVYYVRYENGSVVYVNYNEEQVSVENHMIKALDYLVVDKGGNER